MQFHKTYLAVGLDHVCKSMHVTNYCYSLCLANKRKLYEVVPLVDWTAMRKHASMSWWHQRGNRFTIGLIKPEALYICTFHCLPYSSWFLVILNLLVLTKYDWKLKIATGMIARLMCLLLSIRRNHDCVRLRQLVYPYQFWSLILFFSL